MPNSLKSKLSSLRYKGLITDEEYKELVKKLDGHDREIRNKAIDDFVDKARPFMDTHHDFIMIHKVAELMKIEEDRENGDNRKLLHETGNGQ